MKIPVARLWHKKGKLEYFCFKQLLEYFPNIEFDFHIVLHSPEYKDEWSDKIDLLPINVTWYSTHDMLSYAKECDYIDDDLIHMTFVISGYDYKAWKNVRSDVEFICEETLWDMQFMSNQ